MFKNLLFLGMLPLLTACGKRPIYQMTHPFDTAEVEKLKRPGSASLIGQAFARQRGGGVVTCAGEPVTLFAETSYLLEAEIALNSGKGWLFSPDVAPNVARSVIRRESCDAQGRFAFRNIVPGAYRVETSVSWTVGDLPQGGMARKSIGVSPGLNEVVLTPP